MSLAKGTAKRQIQASFHSYHRPSERSSLVKADHLHVSCHLKYLHEHQVNALLPQSETHCKAAEQHDCRDGRRRCMNYQVQSLEHHLLCSLLEVLGLDEVWDEEQQL